MNLYMVLLEKKNSLKKAGFSACNVPGSSDCQLWFSMGHFDAIHTCILGEQANLFASIQRNNDHVSMLDNEERHLHPLYLISQTDDDNFWKKSSPFIAISRLHYSNTTGANEIYEKLKEYLRLYLDPALDVRIYRTIELCDAVLIVKSDSLVSMLNFALKLRKHANIGRVYSYFAIQDKYLKSSWKPNANEEIPLCSVRFAVSSFPDAQNEINALKNLHQSKREGPFLVIGVDDVLISWENMPVCDFLEIYRSWFSRPEENSLDKAFSSMTTRLGIQYVDTSDWAPSSPNVELQIICENLRNRSNMIFSQQQYRSRTWLRPLSELTYSLLRLSRMPILDEFAYLMIPGVRAFLMRLEPGSDPGNAVCETFVQNWSSVMEHIMRGEGQMSQYPQLRPVLYDIPVAMLEYILAFLDTVADILRRPDKQDLQISLFPVPVLNSRICSKELFAPTPGKPGLVLIMIPLTMLYNPSDMLPPLCHELSHFIGETCRKRAERIEYFADAVSFLFLKHIFRYKHSALFFAVSQQLRCALSGNLRIKNMTEAVKLWAIDFKTDGRYSSQLVKTVMQKEKMSGFAEYPLPYLPYLIEKAQKADYSVFFQAVQDVSILFKECFADVCMLYLLKPDPSLYILSHLNDFALPSARENRPYENVAIRIFSVLNADPQNTPDKIREFFRQVPNRCQPAPFAQLSEHYHRLMAEVEYLCKAVPTERDDDRVSCFPIFTVVSLAKYTKLCRQSLEETIRAEDLRKLHEMYSTVLMQSMDYNQFLNCIDAYRCKIHSSYSIESSAKQESPVS